MLEIGDPGASPPATCSKLTATNKANNLNNTQRTEQSLNHADISVVTDVVINMDMERVINHQTLQHDFWVTGIKDMLSKSEQNAKKKKVIFPCCPKIAINLDR